MNPVSLPSITLGNMFNKNDQSYLAFNQGDNISGINKTNTGKILIIGAVLLASIYIFKKVK